MGNLIDGNNCDRETRTDFEKLIIARIIIKDLSFDKGVLKSEIDELKDKFNKSKNISLFNDLSKEEKLEIKTSEIYKDLRVQIVKFKKQNKRLILDNKNLIYKLHNDAINKTLQENN